MNFATRAALRIGLVYAVVASCWIGYSDFVLHSMLAQDLIPEVQTMKGVFFVLVTAVLLFGLIRRSFRREIATRKAKVESEHRWRELVDHSKEAILLIDGKRVICGNGAAADLIGTSGSSELRGKSVDQVLPEDGPFDAVPCAEDGARDTAYRRSIRRLDGTTRTVEDYSTSVQLDGHQVTLSILIDVTERMEYEHLLVQAKEDAESLAIMKESIVTNMSHEIRTPLTAILGIAEALHEEVDGDAHELAALLQESGWRLTRTLDSILTLAQLESDSTPLAQQPVDVVDATSRIVRTFGPQASEKDISLDLVAQEEGVLILSNPAALDQIIMNLLTNAIKFTHRGSVKVSVSTVEGRALLQVKDTGVGICPEFLPHIFEEFQQESRGINRSFEGSGLGMTIVKRLLDRTGGEISIESEKGVGTTVRTSLPLASVA